MKAICYRHGESLSNAGHATSDPVSIPLTDLGMAQAMAVGDAFLTAPDLIISSPFLRALQTASPLQQKFPEVPFEIWPIQEFTYLSPARLGHSTPAERTPFVDAYWTKSDPNAVDGEGAESFAACMGRVCDTLFRLEKKYADGARNVVLFGHGQFFIALDWVVAGKIDRFDMDTMQAYRHLLNEHTMKNTASILLAYDGAAWTSTDRAIVPRSSL